MAKALSYVAVLVLGAALGAFVMQSYSAALLGSTAPLTTFTSRVTITGKTLNVATANTATSTIIGGCFQFYATSTATALKFQASTTPGIMYSQYGTCPNL